MVSIMVTRERQAKDVADEIRESILRYFAIYGDEPVPMTRIADYIIGRMEGCLAVEKEKEKEKEKKKKRENEESI